MAFYKIASSGALTGNVFEPVAGVFEKFGFAGGVVISLIVIIVMYIKNEEKKISKDVEKSSEVSKVNNSIKEIMGAIEQLKRENAKCSSLAEEILMKLRRHEEEFKNYKQDINREFSDLKTHMREISRDINRKD